MKICSKALESKRSFLSICLICCMFITSFSSGCRAYKGVCIYDEKIPLQTENEKVISETYTLELQEDKYTAYKIGIKTFDQHYKIDKIESWIYTNGSGGQVVGNFILYPFALVFSPLVLIAYKDEEITEFGVQHTYSYGLHLYNTFNPFVCTMGDIQQEKTVLSSEKSMERERSETKTMVADTLTLHWDDRQKTVRQGITINEIARIIFPDILQMQQKTYTISYRDQKLSQTICSHSFLTEAEKKLLEEKRVAAELAKLENPEIKYPCRTKDRPGIKLYKNTYSGTSLEWVQKYAKITGKNPLDYGDSVEFLTAQIDGDTRIIYGCRIKLFYDNERKIYPAEVVEKYKKEYPGIKVSYVDKRAEVYKRYIDKYRESNQYANLCSDEVLAQKLDELWSKHDFCIFTLLNPDVKIIINSLYPSLIQITITDLAYEKSAHEYAKVLERQKENERQKAAQKALDF